MCEGKGVEEVFEDVSKEENERSNQLRFRNQT